MASLSQLSNIDALGLRTALANARKSYEEGGIPIGAALVEHESPGAEPQVLGQGHNQRIQKASAVLHGEIAALSAAGRLTSRAYMRSTMYTTLSPCSMCTGAILLYKIPRVVIGENANFKGDEELLRSRGVEVVVLDDDECKELMHRFIQEKPEVRGDDMFR